ncbi:hypothetical protein HAZT_HAZT008337 [Hyalella azteca]|uniref:TIMELESS-interacting protein n=1 Tax=Hyalella azteca TaxID=294128 RepID=A0A6A0GR24_HYAAZ|nr:hypothetical protein HAZT_HAZT008337 [Hyalella azteca]
MALINQHDEEEMFGLREAEVFSAPNSGSEEDYDDDVPEGERASKPTNPDDAADANAAKVIKPKRIVKNPQPKFDAARLCGPRGIGVVQKFLSNAPYRGKGYETEDLGILLQKLKHWAHRLYPKLPFADTIAQIEKLGNKKPVQVNVKRLRMDMYETPKEDAEAGEVVDDVERVGDNLVTAEDDEPDVFDELLRQSGASLSLQERVAQNSSSSQPSVPISQPVTLSAEVRERIERNRLLALERQRAKIASADTSSSSFLAKTTSNAGLSSPSTVSLGSGKRKRNIHDDSDDEAVQPTQEEHTVQYT